MLMNTISSEARRREQAQHKKNALLMHSRIRVEAKTDVLHITVFCDLTGFHVLSC